MKKNFSIVCISLIIGMVLTAFSPSVDGRAVVADKNEMPEGLFGKTVGYLPGDSVSVTNPANGKTVEILVLGSLDPSEGVAIMLSQQAASELGIQKNSNNLVKLAKRTGKVDESVYGTAVLAQGPDKTAAETAPAADTADATAAAPVTDTAAVPAAATAVPAAADSAAAAAAPAESAAPAADTAASSGDLASAMNAVPDTSAAETPAETPAADTAVNAPADAGTEPVKDTAPAAEVPAEAVTEKAPAAESPAEAVAADEVKPAADTAVPAESVPAETSAAVLASADTATAAPETAAVTPETPAAAGAATGAAETAPAVTAPAVTAPAVTETAVPSTDTTVPAAAETAAVPDTSAAAPATPAETAAASADTTAASGTEYAPIILVPAEPKSPSESKKEAAAADTTTAVTENTVPAETVPAPAAETPAPAVSAAETKPAFTDSGSYSRYLKPSLKALDSGKYYVQIACLSDKSNIQNLINAVAKNYPLVMVPLAEKTAYQMMIGPLNKDEYGTVLERFKEKGYKGAFLRKIR